MTTTNDLNELKKEVDKATNRAMELVRDYEQLQVDFLSSNIDLNIGDIIEVNKIKYFYGGYVLPPHASMSYNLVPRTPILCGFKIKKDGDPSKNKTYLYGDSDLLSKYGKTTKGEQK